MNDQNKELQTEEVSQENMTMDQLFARQEEMRKRLDKREVVKVKVVQVSQDNVLVDTGDKKEGLIPLSDFEGREVPQAGEEVPAVLMRKGGDERYAVLSHKKALEISGWNLCEDAYDKKERVKAVVSDCVKGGYTVDVNGARGFMPLSLSELYPAYKHYLPKSAKIKAVISEFSKEERKMIVSRKWVLEEEEKVRREKVLSEVKVGDILRAVVSKAGEVLCVRFHGIEGVVRLEDVAWKNPREVLARYKRGQRIKVKLLSVNESQGNISFGIKQLFANPADLLKKRYPYMSVAKAIITKIVPEAGVEVEVGKRKTKGFIAQGELSADFAGKEGDLVSTVVLGIDAKNFSLKLSIKRFEFAQNKKVVAQYLRQAPRPTLGQLLQASSSQDEDEIEQEEYEETNAPPEREESQEKPSGHKDESAKKERTAFCPARIPAPAKEETPAPATTTEQPAVENAAENK